MRHFFSGSYGSCCCLHFGSPRSPLQNMCHWISRRSQIWMRTEHPNTLRGFLLVKNTQLFSPETADRITDWRGEEWMIQDGRYSGRFWFPDFLWRWKILRLLQALLRKYFCKESGDLTATVLSVRWWRASPKLWKNMWRIFRISVYHIRHLS